MVTIPISKGKKKKKKKKKLIFQKQILHETDDLPIAGVASHPQVGCQ